MHRGSFFLIIYVFDIIIAAVLRYTIKVIPPMHSYRRQDIIMLFFQIVVWIFIILAPTGVQYLIHPVGNIHLYLISGAWVI